jgi:acyl dehydratase
MSGTHRASDLTRGLAFGTYEEAKRWVGRRSELFECEEINWPQIKLFAGLVEDANPAYWDEAFAKKRYGGILAPPGMLMVWSMFLPWEPGKVRQGPLFAALVPLPGETLINAATETELFLPVVVGDRLTLETVVEDVSLEKETRLGRGHFVTTRGTYRNQRGERVALHANVMFRFHAEARNIAEPLPARDPAPIAPEDRLPELVMPVTLRLCVLDALATRDMFPGHHDRDYARTQNARDVYLNTMFFHGLLDRIGCEWAGPDAVLRRRRLKMIAPVCAGDTIRSSGRVARRYRENERRMVDLEIDLPTEHGPGASGVLTFEM